MPAEITYTLDLALRLMDTVTGGLVTGGDVSLRRDGAAVRPVVKSGGTLLLVNTGRTDFDLFVEARGYEPQTARVRYGELDPRLPQLDLHLVPGRGYRAPCPCLALEGRLPGIAGLCAVRAGDNACLIRSFDAADRLLTLFNPHRLGLDRAHYALVDPDRGRFEPFRILRRIDHQHFRLDRALETPFDSHFPICPVVFGLTERSGRYCLRVRDDAGEARWIVRWGEGAPRFKTLDLRQPELLEKA